MTYDKYIGLPYLANGRTEAGVDCWGLVRLFYKNELNIDLPSYVDDYNGPYDPAIISLMDQYKEVEWKKQAVPEAGDVCVFNIYGEPCHVGVYVGNNKFIHSRENKDVVIESITSPKWANRLEGYYKPDRSNQIQVIGAPHPLKTAIVKDWTVAGTTVQDFVLYTKQKYSISDRLSSKLVVMVDGKKIPPEEWESTVLEQGQTIAYRSVPEGRDTFRMMLMVAVVVAAQEFGLGAEAGKAMGFTTEAGVVTTTGKIVGTMAVNMAAMALVNAVFPIRPDTTAGGVDPGSARGVNLFTGASNQTNKFGAIPVVLGKVRVTGLMGAVPYIETTPDSSLINLLIIWGFGPLSIDNESICVGLTPLSSYYSVNYPDEVPKYETLLGVTGEDATKFNRIYPYDVEQKVLQVELKNNPTDGNTWAEHRFTKKAESLAVGLTFPEGMRQVITAGPEAGGVMEAVSGVEIQIAKHNPSNPTAPLSWNPVSPYSLGYWAGATPNAREFTHTINAQVGISRYISEEGSQYVPLYRYHVFAMLPTGGIQVYQGAATKAADAEPDAELQTLYRNGSYPGLISTDSNYTRMPSIPAGSIPIYTFCTYNGVVVSTTNNLTASGISYTGLQLLQEPVTITSTDESSYGQAIPTGTVNIVIATGKLYLSAGDIPPPGETTTIFTSRQYTAAGIVNTSTVNEYSSLLNTYGIWNTDANTSLNVTKTVVFPYTGYYYVEASIDNYGAMFINGAKVLEIPGFTETTSGIVYLEKGSYPVQITGTNTGGPAAAACRITYTANAGMNALNTNDSGVILKFGEAGFYSKRKDAFNFTYRVNSLPHDYYAVRVRRTTNDEPDLGGEARRYFKTVLFDVTGYSSRDDTGTQVPPVIDPPGCKLAKTAIRIQSSNKVNGQVDGINALVQTLAPTYNGTTWDFEKLKPTNNPASLFIYVLMHPANAYRIEYADRLTSFDLNTLATWYNFCNGNNVKNILFTYNDVVTNTRSVMDVLRDICAAGMASPAYVDGKWTVVIDKPREYTTQFFTPHNSWGFESTKLLPKVPDAFRISYPNEDKAYQIDEMIVYNYGKNSSNALIFESISLPGVTNSDQVEFFAKWHFAQLRLRPEVYTINTDFEYLVCTRGDRVKVAHDVPRWGVSSGRIKSVTQNPITGHKVLLLSESVYLESGKIYSIQIRTNTYNSTTGSLHYATKELVTITTSAIYEQISVRDLTDADMVYPDNLYMIGEIGNGGTVTQDLIVTAIEPTSDATAKITLVDYSPDIYTADITTDIVRYRANITGQNIPLVKNSIKGFPLIATTTSDSSASKLISPGVYQNNLIVSYAHPADLGSSAERVEIQYTSADSEFINNSPANSIIVNKETSSAVIDSLKVNGMYKIRARYIDSSGTIVGGWSPIYYAKNIGKIINYYTPSAVTLGLEGVYLVATASTDVAKPDDFNTYEYRFIQSNGTEDFWDLDIAAYNIKVVQSRTAGRLNITEFPTPRISQAGITYRVACRAIDNNNNYSTSSALSSLVIKTIV
jgi:hypothetical protein